jgi:hypothetical protein
MGISLKNLREKKGIPERAKNPVEKPEGGPQTMKRCSRAVPSSFPPEKQNKAEKTS